MILCNQFYKLTLYILKNDKFLLYPRNIFYLVQNLYFHMKYLIVTQSIVLFYIDIKTVKDVFKVLSCGKVL